MADSIVNKFFARRTTAIDPSVSPSVLTTPTLAGSKSETSLNVKDAGSKTGKKSKNSSHKSRKSDAGKTSTKSSPANLKASSKALRTPDGPSEVARSKSASDVRSPSRSLVPTSPAPGAPKSRLQRLAEDDPSLIELDLANSKIALPTAKRLCDALMENAHLRILNLSHCALGQVSDDPALLIAGMLQINGSLQELNLQHNDFSPVSTRILIEAAAENVGLHTLLLHHNDATDDSAPAICDLLRCNSSLRHFSVDSLQFSPVSILMIEDALQLNFSMENLDFKPQTPPAISSLARRSAKMDTVPLLNAIRFESAVEIAECLQSKAGKKSLNKRVEGWTPLHVAAARGDFMIINLLLEAGAKVNVDGKLGPDDFLTPLDVAIAKCNTVVVELLKPHGAESKARALHLAGARSITLEQLEQVLPLCKYAEELDLRFTGIQSIPMAILDMKKLKIAYVVEGNPLSTVPREIRTRDTEGLKNYLRGMREQAAEWTEVKLIFIGDGGVGKTSLIEAFKHPKGRLASEKGEHGGLATDGIAMSQWTPDFQVKSQQGGNVVSPTFNCWDFGGQDIFYNTHEFFLSQKATYLLMFNLSKGPAKVVYWLRKIKMLTAPELPPIFLVGTHLDEFQNAGAELQQSVLTAVEDILRTYKKVGGYNIIDFVQISSTNGSNVDDLRRAVARCSSEFFTQVPNSYVMLANLVRNKRDAVLLANNPHQLALPHCDWKTFVEFANTARLQPEDVRGAARFLNDCGVIVHFISTSRNKTDDDLAISGPGKMNSQHAARTMRPAQTKRLAQTVHGELDNLVILSPQHLANVMADLISFRTSVKWEDGVITRAQLSNAWEDFPQQIHEPLLQLLQRFEILFDLPDDETPGSGNIFIPSLFSKDPPNDFSILWPANPPNCIEIGRVIAPNFVPLGFFPRLLARLSFYILKRSFVPAMWLHGMVIFKEEETILVQFDPESHALTVTGRQRSDNVTNGLGRHFMNILTEVNTLFESYYEADRDAGIRRSVPCPHCKALISAQGSTNMAEVALVGGRSPAVQRSATMDSVWSFEYDELVTAQSSGSASVTCPNFGGKAKVRIDLLAPDLALAGLQDVLEEDLTLSKELGKGGFGTVYLGDLMIKGGETLKVAVKELNTPPPPDPNDPYAEQVDLTELYDEFQREARVHSLLRHNNICLLIGVQKFPKQRMILEFIPSGDLHGGFHFKTPELIQMRADFKRMLREGEAATAYFVANMSAMDAEQRVEVEAGLQRRESEVRTLEQRIHETQLALNDKHRPWTLRYKIMLDIAKGMRYLQSLSPPIVHRDLRSPNIFLVSLDEHAPTLAKVGDFGLSRGVAGALKEMLRTWQWLAPEVINPKSDSYDWRSDNYSFGIVAWEISAGMTQFPFAENMRDMREQTIKQGIIAEGLRPTIPPKTPARFSKIIQSCWATDPAERMSFAQVCKRLSKMLKIPNEPVNSPTFKAPELRDTADDRQ